MNKENDKRDNDKTVAEKGNMKKTEKAQNKIIKN